MGGDSPPYRCALARGEKRTGRYAVTLAHCNRGRVHRAVNAKPQARYHTGLWIRRNADPGRYRAIVVAHPAPTGGPAILATLPISAERPAEWQEIATDVLTPPTARSLTVYLHVDHQAPDACCWVDDFFIGKCP